MRLKTRQNWMVREMVEPTITVYNCNLSVQSVEKHEDDSFEADDDNEDVEETHKIKTKTQVNLKVKTDMLSNFAKSGMNNWERDVLDLISIDVSKYHFGQ